MLVFLLWVGDFELDLTSYLFYKFVTVVSTILLYHFVTGRIVQLFIMLFLPGISYLYPCIYCLLNLFMTAVALLTLRRKVNKMYLARKPCEPAGLYDLAIRCR